jgi:hypothetical protein
LEFAFFVAMANVGLNLPQVSEARGGERRALLVGVTRYPGLKANRQLRGPANDVVLFRDLLMHHFRFPKEGIVTLAEHVKNDELRPTRANIVRHMESLIAKAQSGDQIVVFLAGHGSQQPDNDSEGLDDEPDGLDETFLPSDIGEWDAGKSIVTNAIIDDEIQIWLDGLRKKGAFVFFVADSCHSGTLTRGNGTEVSRNIDSADLIPQHVLTAARRKAAAHRSTSFAAQRSDGLDLPPNRGGLVALYAAQSGEEEIEALLPRNADAPQWHGLLTYTFAELLAQARTPLTYRELIRQIHQRYIALGRRGHPTALMEGTNLQREILGETDWPARPQLTLSHTASRGFGVDSGAMHGMTKGSILAVFPPAGSERADKLLGHVQVDALRPLESTVVPVEYNGAPRAQNLPSSGRCQLVFQDFGDLRLAVGVDELDIQNRPVEPDRRTRLLEILKKASEAPGSLIRVQQDPTRTDWLVRPAEDDVYLVPASGFGRQRQNSPDGSNDKAAIVPSALYGPGRIDGHVGEWLSSRLRKIARVNNLHRIVGTHGETTDGSGINIKVDAILLGEEGKSLRSDSDAEIVREGDQIRLRVRNEGTTVVDVTLLYLDADYGITSILPRSGTTDTNRIGPNQSLSTVTLEITPAHELEHVIAIAVRAEPQRPHAEFSSLAQDSLERARNIPGSEATLESPFGKLLQNAVFAEGATRGIKTADISRYSIRRLTWRVDPKAAAK